MKYLILLSNLFACIVVQAQNSEYYYYKGKKVNLNVNEERVFIIYKDKKNTANAVHDYYMDRKLNWKKEGSKDGSVEPYIGAEIILPKNKSYQAHLAKLKQNPKVEAIEAVIGLENPMLVNNFFYVKLLNQDDLPLLESITKTAKCKVLYKVETFDLWYALEVDKNSYGNSIATSNYFYETGLFDEVDPGFMMHFSDNCVGDSRFNDQWAINDVGEDINACEAWEITKGCSDVVVAIVDRGIENTHSEFVGTNFTMSYDAFTGTSPAQALYGTDGHGTHIAGVIAANHNASLMAGIAPNSSIMEIAFESITVTDLVEDLATGINWAVQNGADIINCSWGDQGGTVPGFHSTLLEDALDNAIDNGRGGLGTVVVFASGNESPLPIDYPGNYRDEILVVGSINSQVVRPSNSAFGSKLDVVAPGEAIYSSVYNNTHNFLSGTSQAAPHVSGLAALILSVNSNLTRAQVTNIIERSAQKIGNGINYQTTPGRSNGTWNNEMGYGLIDMKAALDQTPYPSYIYGTGTVCNTISTFSIINPTVNPNVIWTKSSNLTYVSGQGTTNAYTVKAATPFTTGAGWIEASIIDECGNRLPLRRKTVWVGRPGPIGGSIIGPSTANTNDYITFLHTGPFTPGTYKWKVPGNGGVIPPNTNPCNCWKIYSGANGARMYTYVGVYDGNVEVSKTNACGNGPAVHKYVDVQSGGGGGGGPIAARVAPNPTVSTEMNISFVDKTTGEPLDLKAFEYEVQYTLRNMQGSVVHQSKSKQKKKKINVRKLAKTKQYILTIEYGDNNKENIQVYIE